MNKKAFIIGITGGSGSGKTTFIHKLKERFSTEQICVLSQDDYYRPMDEQVIDDEGIENFDLPESIDHEAFYKELKDLISGKTVSRKEYTFNNSSVEPNIFVFKPAPIIIVEGIFVFHFKEIFELFDLKIFLDAKENLKVIRRIKRDRVERNYPLDDVLYRYENHVLPTFEKYILPYKPDADIVINNNIHFNMALDVLTGFIENKLKE